MENTQFRSSPLLVAAKRYVSVATEINSVEITSAEKPKIRKILAESCAEKTESLNKNLKSFACKTYRKTYNVSR